METIIYVGADVHKDTYSLCCFTVKEKQLFGETTIPADSALVIKYLKRIEKGQQTPCLFVVGYEAGPTGYGLCRDLQKAGYSCVVMAPTTIKRASGERVKTDRKDAQMLAQTLAYDTYRPVYLPTKEFEAVKEYTRARNTMKNRVKKAKQNLLSFLLRMGNSYPESGSYWTQKHFAWLKTIQFADPILQLTFDEYYCSLNELINKLALMDAKIEEISQLPAFKKSVDKLVCFCGIETHTALSLVVEVGDYNRFTSATSFSSFLGVCPGEDSSGQRIRRNSITKTGNVRLRLLLTEAAKGIKRSSLKYGKSKRLLLRQKNADPSVIVYADKGSRRIRAKIEAMEKRGVHCNIATTAAARELACFVWGMMTDHIA